MVVLTDGGRQEVHLSIDPIVARLQQPFIIFPGITTSHQEVCVLSPGLLPWTDTTSPVDLALVESGVAS